MMKFFTSKNLLSVKLRCIILLSIAVLSCNKESTYINLPIYGPEQEFYALSDNNLLKFNARTVKTQLSKIAIKGLGTSEKLLSIDFRPATGELYGLSDASKIYIINIINGTARIVSTTAFTPALAGTIASIDFNPVTDRLRVVTNTGQNLSLNPETGMVDSTDGVINGANGAIVNGIAYNNSIAGVTTATLFDVDPVVKKLYKQEPSASGTLVEIGNLELDLGTNVSFDISPSNANILAVGKNIDATRLYTINLTSGKATLAGTFAVGTTIQGIAIPTDPVAYATTFDDTDHTNSLIIFNPSENNTPAIKLITGLQTGETILGMDMRPRNGQIYILGSTNRLYTVNTGTGAVTQVGTGVLSTALVGTSFGFDFNPATDRIRVVSNTGQNLRLNPNDGSVTIDPALNPDAPTVSAAAYASNFVGATTTKLYVIDYETDKLYSQDENTGTLTPIGNLTVDVEGANGFDIISSGTADTAYVILTVAGAAKVYKANLATGVATLQGEFSKTVTAFTLGLKF